MANFFTKLFSGWGSGGAITPPANARQRMRATVRLEPEQTQAPPNIEQAQNTAHSLVLNTSIGESVCRAFRNGVIGKGVQLRSEIRRKNRDRATGEFKLNTEANEHIVKEWNQWGRCCTTDGQLSWVAACKKIVTAIVEGGECFVLFYDIAPYNDVKNITCDIPFSFRILEADNLDTTYAGTTQEGTYWLEGIKYDYDDRPIAYAFKTWRETAYETRIFDSRNTLHLFLADKTRPQTRRGWPLLTPVLGVIDRAEAFMATALAHAEQNCAVNTYIVPDPQTAEPAEQEDYDAVAELSNRGGGIKILPPGSQVVEKQQIGSSSVTDYIFASKQSVAEAVGLTYEGVTGDHTRSNFSSSRMSNIIDVERFEEFRQYLEEDFFEVCYRRWLRAFLLVSPHANALPKNANQFPHSWSYKHRPYVEPAKAAMAAKTMYELGIVSKSTLARDFGIDFESELKQQQLDLKAEEPLVEARQKLMPLATQAIAVEGNKPIKGINNDQR